PLVGPSRLMASAMLAMAWPDWTRRSHASVEFLKVPSFDDRWRMPLEPSAWHDWQEFLTVSIQKFCDFMNSGMPLPLAPVPGNWSLAGISSIEYQYMPGLDSAAAASFGAWGAGRLTRLLGGVG